MKIIGDTVSHEGKIIPVYGCEICTFRSIYHKYASLHEHTHIDNFHEEEFKAGNL